MNYSKIKDNIFYLVCMIIILLISFTTFICYKKYRKELVLKEITYYSADNSSYDVYYSGSDMISGKTTETGFIRRYIDHINLNYDYALNFSNIIDDGTQETLIKAMMVIYAPNSDTPIWKSDVDYLSQSKITEYQNASRYKFSKSISIDYKKYLNLYEQFKDETSIISNAVIHVEFISSNIANVEDLPKIIKTDTITYSIPLSDVTFTIDKKTNVKGEEKTVKNVTNSRNKNLYLLIIVLCLTIIFMLITMLILKYTKDKNKKGYYKNTLNKIVKSYDNIIVNIETIPQLSDKKVINVTSFEELLDAQMEIRVPINYCETIKNYESKFMIMSNDMVWVYTLKKEGRK